MMLCLMKKILVRYHIHHNLIRINGDASGSDVYPVCYVFGRKNCDVITFAQFEEENIWTETRNDTESGDESDNKSIMMSKQDMENINSGDESDHDLISTDMLEDILDGSQTHPDVNRR